MTQQPVVATGSYTLEDVEEPILTTWSPESLRRDTVWSAAGLGFILIVMLGAVPHFAWAILGVAAAALSITFLLVYVFALRHWRVRRGARKRFEALGTGDVSMTFDGEGVEILGRADGDRVAWSSIWSATETERTIVLWLRATDRPTKRGSPFIVIPDRWLQPTDRARLRELVRQKLGDAAERA